MTQDLVKQYNGVNVVDQVSIELNDGEIVGLLGPNGAGKTTTFNMILGIIRPHAGRIFLDETDLSRLPIHLRARRGIGYLAQDTSIFRKLTVEENILAVLEMVKPKRKERKKQLDALLEEFRITRLRKSPSMALSGGERRRVEIARALASRPSFMLLDEPFAGIDPIAVGDIRALVRHLTERGIGVLITDHNVRETLKITDRAYILREGRVSVELYDVSGRRVASVYDGDMSGGEQEVVWDGRGSSGENCAAGIYFVRVTFAGRESADRKIVKLK